MPDGLGESKVDDSWRRPSVHLDHQNVRRLQIAMDDGFLMSVLHALARLNEKLQALRNGQFVLIAIFGNRQPRHIFHDQVGLPQRGRAGIEYLGDCRMVHNRERLSFGAKALHHGCVVHPRLDELQGNLSAHRCVLLGQPDLAHPALAQHADEFVTLRENLAALEHRAVDFILRRAHPVIRERRCLQKIQRNLLVHR